jgi:cytochrome c-type biogenesis protein CcmE
MLVGASAGSSHYRMVDQLVHEGFGGWTDKELELHGKVEPRSIHEQVVRQQTTRSFVLVMNGEKLRVFSTGPVPDTFKDESELIATGYLVPAASKIEVGQALGIDPAREHGWVMEASNISAKCASHYGDQPPTERAKFSGSGH